MNINVDTIRDLAERDYKWGFVTKIGEERVPPGSISGVFSMRVVPPA